MVIGNLSVGGSGKSPTVVYLAELLADMGWPVVIGCSGYGSPRSEGATLAPPGALRASEWGDEPAMFRDRLPDVPLVVGRQRVRAAELVEADYPGAVLLMDDGFQHLPLEKDLAILIQPVQETNRFCLPAGPYREPRSNLSRADAVLWTGEGSGFRLVRGDLKLDGHVSGPVTTICALGQPEQFLGALGQCAEVIQPLILPDHDPLTSGTLFVRLPPNLPIVVTTKDWVKLRERPDLDGRTIIVARQEVRVEPEGEFREWLEAKLDESKKI